MMTRDLKDKRASIWMAALLGSLLVLPLSAGAATEEKSAKATAENATADDTAPVLIKESSDVSARALDYEVTPGGQQKLLQLTQTDVAPPSVSVGPSGPGAPAGAAGGSAAPGAPPSPGGMPPGMPPLSVILGYADFMLAIDRPYEAEKIYKQIMANMPKMDPNDPKVAEMMKNMPKEQLAAMQQAMAAVQKGMKDVEYAKRPTMTALGHVYHDDRNVQLYAYGGGPTFRSKYGKLTLTAGTGHYRNNNDVNNPNNPLSLSPDIPSAEDNDTLKKNTLNLLLEPYYKKWEGSVFLSNVTYDAAPDRFLYDFKLSYVPNPARERYYISTGRHDSYFQNVNNQFYAPETFFQLKRKILYDDVSVGFEHPVGAKFDSSFSFRSFDYTDGNRRSNYRATFMYRIKPTKGKQMPVWRVGTDFIWDDSKFFTLDYTASENFNAYSLATDYMWISRKLKYGAYFSYPIAEQNFNAPYGLFGFASYQLSKSTELYAKFARLDGSGNSITFSDNVIGVNVRF